jgi:hypothetical protein
MLLAEQWPDGVDLTATTLYLSLVVAAPLLGYALLAMDIRRYVRSLRRALVIVVNYFPELPGWAREPTPKCIAWFGLEMPCREEALLQAYRERVKQLHPDRGGDRRRFLKMQRNFEEALEYLRRRDESSG